MAGSGTPRGIVIRYYLYMAASSLGFFVPVWVVFLEANGLSFTQITTLDALFFAAIVVAEVPTGYLGDRIGRRNALVVSSLVLGVAAAAVDLEFSGEYDGYGGDATDVAGNEIEVTGTITVTGSSAVSPTIRIASTDATVLDLDSAEILVPSDQSIQFDRSYNFRQDRLEFRAEEVPDGTTLEVRFVVYPTGEPATGTIDSARVSVNYETASGSRQTARNTVTTELTNSPAARIDELENQLSNQEGAGMAVLGLAGVGGLAILVLLGFAAYKALGLGGGGGRGGGGRRR